MKKELNFLFWNLYNLKGTDVLSALKSISSDVDILTVSEIGLTKKEIKKNIKKNENNAPKLKLQKSKNDINCTTKK
jgi:hypothetical protein